ncbi:MAG TPA: hypothetical protein VK731_13695 [Candidatus Cybelea sp.]|nr:hypothetical protein [Candidatus Cybelea sp.]
MITKQIALGLAAVAVAGLWFGRLAWRAHQNLVTLHVRNTPLVEVVKSLERQTWEKIRFDKKLGAKITLNVKDAPLDQVMDLVADRAGARWQKTFAVGADVGAMAKLEAALEDSTKLNDAGWTNIAPGFSDLALDNPPGGGPEPVPGKPGMMLHRQMPRTEDTVGGKSGKAGDGAMMVAILPDGTIDRWSSERLVLESSLLPRLGPDLPSEATVKTTARVAASVHGRSQLYYVLAKSPFEMGPMMGGGRRLMGPPKTGPEHPDLHGAVANMAQMSRQRRLRELSRSPEEQVERARQNSADRMRFESHEENN